MLLGVISPPKVVGQKPFHPKPFEIHEWVAGYPENKNAANGEFAPCLRRFVQSLNRRGCRKSESLVDSKHGKRDGALGFVILHSGGHVGPGCQNGFAHVFLDPEVKAAFVVFLVGIPEGQIGCKGG